VETVDLLIIGSGPAGLSTALHLLSQDSNWSGRMVIIEKARHPRSKLCGGGLTRIGLDTLLDLGLQLPLPIPSVAIEEARLIYQDSTISMKGQPIFEVYNRIEFDHFLYNYARQRGILIHENEVVQSISLKPNRVEVTTSKDTYHADVVVGADGSKGITRKLIKDFGSKRRVARVLETIYAAQGVEAPFRETYASFDFTPNEEDLQGYYWEFPSKVENRAYFNRGVYDSRYVSGRERADLPVILNEQINIDQKIQSNVSFQGHPIHWFHPGNRFSLPHMVLVGDAAGAEPLFGEGIGPALAYGKLAAEEIVNAFHKQEFSFKYYKRRVLTSALGRYLLFRWLLASLSYHLCGNSLFIKALWLFGKVITALWPKPNPLYSTKIQKMESDSRDMTKDFAN
jgi:flavin-dependent dehydrogenase